MYLYLFNVYLYIYLKGVIGKLCKDSSKSFKNQFFYLNPDISSCVLAKNDLLAGENATPTWQ